MFYYSPNVDAFYPEDILHLYENAGTLPDDLVEVTDDDFVNYSLKMKVYHTRTFNKDSKTFELIDGRKSPPKSE